MTTATSTHARAANPEIGDEALIPLYGGRTRTVVYQGNGRWETAPIRGRTQRWQRTPNGWLRTS